MFPGGVTRFVVVGVLSPAIVNITELSVLVCLVHIQTYMSIHYISNNTVSNNNVLAI